MGMYDMAEPCTSWKSDDVYSGLRRDVTANRVVERHIISYGRCWATEIKIRLWLKRTEQNGQTKYKSEKPTALSDSVQSDCLAVESAHGTDTILADIPHRSSTSTQRSLVPPFLARVHC